ncbi:hypothetical protein KM043_001759 [Ampulex compressa]|nr:hypothetical protein KM043_001759 [Ampulex compressa]
MPITALDKNTVKLLTTTQIITSVRTAVKELIENALDANAKYIEINLVDYGASLIEVKDDGYGISKTDIPYVALPSHTSKISNFTDLDMLETYGFRGEALNALCVVADVTIVTKTNEDDAATSYIMDQHGNIINAGLCHGTTGTTIQARQLFKRTPVRRQIITNTKRANQDAKLLEILIKAFAICKYSVRFNYKLNNSVIFTKPGMNNMMEAVAYVLGRKVMSNMEWIQEENTEINFYLMIPRKRIQDKADIFNSGSQYIFVNNRPIRNKELERIISRRILENVGEEMHIKKKPIFILHILIKANDIDVNLEPNKTAVLFKDERVIYDAIDRYLQQFYGIPLAEKNEMELYNESDNYCLDTTCLPTQDNTEEEWPACKKRKLQMEKNIAGKHCVRIDLSPERCINSTKNVPECESQLSSENRRPLDRFSDNTNIHNNNKETELGNVRDRIQPLDLSDSDSNHMQEECSIISCLPSNASNNANKNVIANDSPPFQLSPNTVSNDTYSNTDTNSVVRGTTIERLSQLPVVDLGEDFILEDVLRESTGYMSNKEENEGAIAILPFAKTEIKDISEERISLETWSKGQVIGLKGGADVTPYVSTKCSVSSMDASSENDVCSGFIRFSRDIRPRVLKENPMLTVPQVAHKIADFWKKLSPEERGYYRDLAFSEKINSVTGKRSERRERSEKECAEKNKKRFLNMLEKMKDTKLGVKGNLMMRTAIPWNVDLQKITANSFKKPSYGNVGPAIGPLYSNVWAVKSHGQIWILNTLCLKEGLNVANKDAEQDDAQSVEKLLKQWIAERNDMSLLYSVYNMIQSGDNP